MTFQQYLPEGTWEARFDVGDRASQNNYHVTAELEALGFPTELTMVSNQDIEPPVLVEFGFNPKGVDVTAGPDSVTCTARITDNLSGANHARCDFWHPAVGSRSERRIPRMDAR